MKRASELCNRIRAHIPRLIRRPLPNLLFEGGGWAARRVRAEGPLIFSSNEGHVFSRCGGPATRGQDAVPVHLFGMIDAGESRSFIFSCKIKLERGRREGCDRSTDPPTDRQLTYPLTYLTDQPTDQPTTHAELALEACPSICSALCRLFKGGKIRK